MLPGKSWWRLVVGTLGASWLAGCNLIAGIDEGVPFDAAPDGGTQDGGHRVDATSPDAKRPDAKGPDAKSPSDARTDVVPPRDAPSHDGQTSDARDAASKPVTCVPLSNPLALQNLKQFSDGGPATVDDQLLFIVYVRLNGPVILAEVNGSTSSPVFFIDQPDGHGTSYNTLTVRGTQLYDAIGGDTARMLTSVGSPGAQNGLQMVTLPSSVGNPADAGWTQLGSPSNQYGGAQVVPVDAGPDAAPFAYVALESVGSQTQLVMGPGSPGDPEGLLVAGSSSNDEFRTIWNDTFLSAGGSVFALIGEGAPDAGESAFATYSAPENDPSQIGPAGVLNPPEVDAAFSTLVGVNPSSQQPGAVDVVAVATSSMFGPYTLYGGTVPASQLANLTVSVDAGFTSSVVDDVPIGQGAPAWGADTMALAGGATVPVDGGVQPQVSLVWLGLDTRIIATFTHDIDNPLTGAAVVFEPGTTTSPLAATFDLVWMEQGSGDAGMWSELFFMSVECK